MKISELKDDELYGLTQCLTCQKELTHTNAVGYCSIECAAKKLNALPTEEDHISLDKVLNRDKEIQELKELRENGAHNISLLMIRLAESEIENNRLKDRVKELEVILQHIEKIIISHRFNETES